MGFTSTTTRKLRAKLNGDHIRTREWNGKTLSYIEGWHALSEANRIFGFDGWSRETVELKCIVESSTRQAPHCAYIARVRISVQAGEEQVVREGTGAGYTAAGSLAEAHALAAKEAETDATKRALATFGNPFGLALYDREQKNVRRAKAPAAKPVLWEVRDSAGIVTGKYADPATCASSLITAFEASDDVEDLQRLWDHNKTLIGRLQAISINGSPTATNGNGRHNSGGNGSGRNNGTGKPASGVIDLLGPYQARYTVLRDLELVSAPDGSDTNHSEDNTEIQGEAGVQMEGYTAPGPRSNQKESIDKSELTIASPKRIRAPEHLKWVATLPCLICQRQPSDAHHLKRVQPNAMGRKTGDQWVVPLCRIHHRALHNAGDETRWWEEKNIKATEIAETLWADRALINT
jgi:DNA recombination protein Rad52